jgi:hypothetical protein
MTPQQLIKKIRALPVYAPHTEALERASRKKRLEGPQQKRTVWYTSQKEHWLGWLREYNSPGYYGRRRFDRDAGYAYRHCGCPPMALWLGEAAGVDERLVAGAKRAVMQSEGTLSAKCGIIRSFIRWEDIESRLT